MLDVVIIGGGPAGLSAALYAKRAMLDVTVIEKSSIGGGQIVYTNEIDNYIGLPGIGGFDLAEKFKDHVENLGVVFQDSLVVKIKNSDHQLKEVIMEDGNSILTKTVIIATGAHHKKLGIDGEEKFIGAGVSYCATCDGAFFRNRVVVVIGGGDVAFGDAIYLSKICRKVYLVHRSDQLRAAKKLQDTLFHLDNIEFIPFSEVKKIDGDESIEKIVIFNNKSEEFSELQVDGVFIAIGMEPDTAFIKNYVDTDQNGYIKANEDGITSVPGIFVAGDVRTKKLRQIITAASDGANCIYSIEEYLRDFL